MRSCTCRPNSLGHDETLDIGFWGLPVLASARASAAAASFRTAWRFRSTWEPAYAMLTEAAEGGVDLRKFFQGVRSPDHWSGPAFAVFLRQAWLGGELCPSESARLALRVSKKVCLAPIGGKNVVQREATAIFRQHLTEPTWNELLKRRRCSYSNRAPAIDVAAAVHLFKQLGRFNCASAIKTAIGAWHTSRRMHEDPILRCLLGCGGEDSLLRSATCAALRALFCEIPALAPEPPECLFHFGSAPAVVRCARWFQLYALLKFKSTNPSVDRAREYLSALEADFNYRNVVAVQIPAASA